MGINADTISNMMLYLVAALNAKFPKKYKKSEDEITVKLLQCLNPPRAGMTVLATMALDDICKADKFLVNVHRSAEVMRDAWEPIWRATSPELFWPSRATR